MRFALMVVLLVLTPLAAAGQQAVPVPAAEPTIVSVDAPRARARESATGLWLQGSQPAQAPPRVPAERPRRRPSMVGYITDAGIQSQVRVRFDAGTEIDSPDRAEFFYPKCGCYRDL